MGAVRACKGSIWVVKGFDICWNFFLYAFIGTPYEFYRGAGLVAVGVL